jgi:putative two-component system response regulator
MDRNGQKRDRSVANIVVADDAKEPRDLACRLLRREGHNTYQAENGAVALDLVTSLLPDLVISDVMMPELNGFELCRQIKGNPSTCLIPVILLTGLPGREDRLEGIGAGADDFLIKPFDPMELLARVRALLKMRGVTAELDSAETVILSLARTVEARDNCTSGHCERMAAYAEAFGRHLGLPEDDIKTLCRAAYVHDLGKICVPDSILLKPGPLTPDELTVMQRHTIVGENLCGDVRFLRHVRPIVRHHHERLDGSGYPDGLRAQAIPILAQIISIVDVYDALTNERPYHAALSPDEARAELQNEVQRGWRDTGLVAEFIAVSHKEVVAQPPATQAISES